MVWLMSLMKTMSTRIIKFVRAERFVFIVAASVIVVSLVTSFFSYPVIRWVEATYFNMKAEKVSAGIVTDEHYVFKQVGGIATSPDLIAALQKKDTLGILGTLRDEQDAHQLTTLAVTDEHGIVLMRTVSVSRNGDYLFQETPYGQEVARGIPTVSVERGTALPLLVVAGFPVDENAKMIGALFGGYLIDDAYAHNFRGAYLNSSINLIYYSKDHGVVGTTFEASSTKTLLSQYFNIGSDWIQKRLSNREVILEGRSYFLINVELPGLKGSPGGVLVLYPLNYPVAAGLRALILALSFLLIVFYFHIYRARKKCYFADQATLAVLFMIVLLFCFFNAIFGLYLDAFVVKSPPFTIYNATLSLQPDSGIFDRSFGQRVAVHVSTGGEAINSALIDLVYDPAKLQVTDIFTANSFCSPSMFLEKTINNSNGEVRVACGLPSPGFSGEGTVIEFGIQPLQEGEAVLRFSSSTEILANDGLGTDVLRLSTDAGYEIADGRNVFARNGIPSVLVFSPTHPNSERWYNQSNVLTTWASSPGYKYRYSLDQIPTPVNIEAASTTASSSITLSHLTDGIYYFHIAAEENGAIGPISDYKIMIDTTSPASPMIELSQSTILSGQVVRMAVESHDALSGLEANYYVKFDDGVFLPAVSPLFVSLPEGTHKIVVRVFDRAGNFIDGSIWVNVAKAK